MTKDYTLLIGKKFGDREVLDITRKYNGKWNAAFAICKCKCGSIDEIPMNQLKAGRRSRCPKCAEKHENKSTGIRHISYDKANDDFIITIERNGQRIIKHTRTLDEALSIKKKLLETFDTYGRFDIGELRKDRSHKEISTRNSRKVNNSYSYVIGQKLGDWEIIHVSEPIAGKTRKRIAQLRDNADNVREVSLGSVLDALQRRRKRQYRIKSNTNIKNISYIKKYNHYLVQIARNGVQKTRVAKTLEEAIKIKEQILQEFETESVANG